jgi:hypothetical protein
LGSELSGTHAPDFGGVSRECLGCPNAAACGPGSELVVEGGDRSPNVPSSGPGVQSAAQSRSRCCLKPCAVFGVMLRTQPRAERAAERKGELNEPDTNADDRRSHRDSVRSDGLRRAIQPSAGGTCGRSTGSRRGRERRRSSGCDLRRSHTRALELDGAGQARLQGPERLQRPRRLQDGAELMQRAERMQGPRWL